MSSLHAALPLDRTRKEIRLITLCPGAFGDGITCSMSVVSLLETPKYEALSYVWGDANQRETILLNNQEFQVTRNLALALRYLREGSSEGRILWIDALSIDQSSDKEKAWQVAMMSSIYASCHTANVWLGPEMDRNDMKHAGWFSMTRMYPGIDVMMQMTLGLILELAQDKHLSDLNGLDYREGEWDPCDDDPSLALQGIRVLLHRPWWERVWVIQEVAIPPKTVITVGYLQLDWEDFSDAANNFLKHSKSCCREAHSRIKGYDNGYLENFHNAVNPIAVLHAKRPKPEQNSDFLELFYGFCDRKATLGVDKIFSLYGLLDPDDALLQQVPVDYTVKSEDVCRQVTMALLNTGCLDVLAGDNSLKSLVNRPSWEKDFTVTVSSIQKHKQRERYAHQQLFEPYCESGRDKIVPGGQTGSLDPGILRLRGVHVDTIHMIVGKPYPEQLILDTQDVFPWLIALEDMIDATGSYPVKVNAHQNLKEAFWRTMLGEHTTLTEPVGVSTAGVPGQRTTDVVSSIRQNDDQVSDSQIKVSSTPFANRVRLGGDYLTAMADWLPTVWKQRRHASLNGFEEAMLTTVLGRGFAMGNEGYFGLVPKQAQAGDEIWVLHGGRLPFVLRRSDGSNDSRSMVGDSFIHEIMDGLVGGEEAIGWEDVLLC